MRAPRSRGRPRSERPGWAIGDAHVDRLLGLRILGEQRHLLDLLHRGDAGVERAQGRRPRELDRALGEGLRKWAVWSSTTNSNPTRSASRQMKSQSVSLSCCMKSCGSPLGSQSALEARLSERSSRRCRSRSGSGTCVPCANAAARATGRSPRTSSSTPPAPNVGSSVTISPLNRLVVLSSSRAPRRISSLLADVERMLVDRLGLTIEPLGERGGERADVGQPQVVQNSHLADPAAELGVDLPGRRPRPSTARRAFRQCWGSSVEPRNRERGAAPETHRVVDPVRLGDHPPACRVPVCVVGDRRKRVTVAHGVRAQSGNRAGRRVLRLARRRRVLLPAPARGRRTRVRARRLAGTVRTGSTSTSAPPSAASPSPS